MTHCAEKEVTECSACARLPIARIVTTTTKSAAIALRSSREDVHAPVAPRTPMSATPTALSRCAGDTPSSTLAAPPNRNAGLAMSSTPTRLSTGTIPHQHMNLFRELAGQLTTSNDVAESYALTEQYRTRHRGAERCEEG
jgi:hypothetical protein